jgi:nucleotide-binding universal stress UspA family protein
MYGKVIVAVDGSDSSQKALQEAKRMLANQVAQEVEVVYVAPTFRNEIFYTDKYNAVLDPLYAQMLAEGEKLLEKCAGELEGYNVKTTLLKGEPPAEIAKLAKNNCDLVIVGSRGKNPISNLILGSVSSRVLQIVDCPVLIIK